MFGLAAFKWVVSFVSVELLMVLFIHYYYYYLLSLAISSSQLYNELCSRERKVTVRWGDCALNSEQRGM